MPFVKAEDAGTYICTARSDGITVDIPTILTVTGVVPFFVQAPSSYMQFERLPDAQRTFKVELSFKPENPNGEPCCLAFLSEVYKAGILLNVLSSLDQSQFQHPPCFFYKYFNITLLQASSFFSFYLKYIASCFYRKLLLTDFTGFI